MKNIAFTLFALSCLTVPIFAADEMEKKTPEAGVHTQLQVTIKDDSRGLNFELHPDGKVELTVKEDKENKEKSYKAVSMDEFKSKYPDVAKKYQVERFLPRTSWGTLDSTSTTAWNDWKKWFGNDWFWDKNRDADWMKEWWKPLKSDDLDNWFEDQQRLFGRFRDMTKPSDPMLNPDLPTASPAFGLRIDAVNDSLAAQLGLREGEGILVVNVLDNMPAQRAGLKKHDIILSLNGKPITDRGEFRKQVRDLAGKGFELEIVRQGRHETIKVPAEKV